MRIIVSSDNCGALDSSVSHHFGRCPYFTVVDVEEDRIINAESVENPYFGAHSPGQVPAHVRQMLGAEVMLAGGMGRRAIDIFNDLGIDCRTVGAGTVRNAVEKYLAGILPGASPCAESTAHSQDDRGYESEPAERLREEAAVLLKELDDVIVRLPDHGKNQ